MQWCVQPQHPKFDLVLQGVRETADVVVVKLSLG